MLQFFENKCIKIFLTLFFLCELNGDEFDKQKWIDDFMPELYTMYRKSLDFDENVISFRRVLRNNREYNIHVRKLKDVNGFKRHNLIVREESANNPIIYINNPVETRIPNAYLSLEEFKKELTDRILRQRKEFDNKKYVTYATLKLTNTTPKKVVKLISTKFKKRTTSKPGMVTPYPKLMKTSELKSTINATNKKDISMMKKPQNETQNTVFTVMMNSTIVKPQSKSEKLPKFLRTNEKNQYKNEQFGAKSILVDNSRTKTYPSPKIVTTEITTFTTVELNTIESITKEPESTIEESTNVKVTIQSPNELDIENEFTTEIVTTRESSDESSTEMPTTEESTTKEPTTEEQTTAEPTTEVPTTEESTIEESTTEESTTEEPNSQEPTTEESTTEVPTTEESTMEEPTTKVSTTERQTSEEITTTAKKITTRSKRATLARPLVFMGGFENNWNNWD